MATESLQNVLGALNDRAVGSKVLADIAAAAPSIDSAQRPCKRLAKRLKGSGRHNKRHLKQAWKAFKKAEPFWRTSTSSGDPIGERGLSCPCAGS